MLELQAVLKTGNLAISSSEGHINKISCFASTYSQNAYAAGGLAYLSTFRDKRAIKYSNLPRAHNLINTKIDVQVGM